MKTMKEFVRSMKKLILKKIYKLFKEADLVWQDQQDKNVFYFVNERQLYIKKRRGRPPKHSWNPKSIKPPDTSTDVST